MNFMQEIVLSINMPAAENVLLKDRLPILLRAPLDADTILGGLKILVVGCGAIGRCIALHLARLKISELRLIDKKKIKKESLLTHSVVPQEISMPKASSLGRIAKAISPGTQIFVYDGAVETLDFTWFQDTDFVILATDNLNAEITVGQRCLWLGIPLIHAAVHGDTLVAQVRFFGTQKQNSCPACGYSRAEWNASNRQTKYSCEANAPHTESVKIYAPPTRSVSFLCSLAADLSLAQVLRHTLDLGTPVESTILEFCMYTHKTAISPLKHNPNCPCDHTPFERASTLGKVSEFSLAEIVRIAGYDRETDLTGVSFRIGDMQFCEKGFCKCSQNKPLKRFVRPGKRAERCKSCGENIYPRPFFTYRNVPAALVLNQLDCRLRDLEVKTEKWAMLRGPQNSLILMESQIERHKS
jgi:molybdopterin/thiamine biosynthesis adenylyltransferase